MMPSVAFVPDDGAVATRDFGMDIMFQPRIPFSFGLEATQIQMPHQSTVL